MKIQTIKNTLEASLIHGENNLNISVDHIYASDLMSDVLAFGKPNSILLTGLATQQAVISAHMAEFKGVVFIRGKKPNDKSADFARNNQLVLLSTNFDMYDACVKLEAAQGKKSQKTRTAVDGHKAEEVLLSENFTIHENNFANAGAVSTEIKSILKTIGFDPVLIRRVAISTYEAELNVVMHAKHGTVNLSVTPNFIRVIVDDVGKGIPDVDLALKEGYTTATDEMRAMGFGSGMGLPNINRNSDELIIKSEVDKGTNLEIKFYIT